MKEELKQKTNEVSVVDWYLEIMEAGKNAKAMIDLFMKEKNHM